MDNVADKKVFIKLDKGDVPYILGAMELGMELEYWYAIFTYPRLKYCSGYASDRWLRYVDYLKKEICKQTKITDENMCYGSSNETMKKIEDILEKQFKIEDKKCLKEEKSQIPVLERLLDWISNLNKVIQLKLQLKKYKILYQNKFKEFAYDVKKSGKIGWLVTPISRKEFHPLNGNHKEVIIISNLEPPK
jgi:hypothetical protein